MNRPALMGIVNITPDSFSGDGKLAQDAVAHAMQLVRDGADIIDLGAESTRPGATALTADAEWARLEPVLNALIAKDVRTRARISIDTCHAETAFRALGCGVDIINDVSGLADPAMIEMLEEYECDIVVMHALSVPADPSVVLPAGCDVVAELVKWKQEVTERATARGIARERLIYDPGIGFGKTAEQSLKLMYSAAELKAAGGRWLYGHSRKSFMKLLGEDSPTNRDALTLQFSQELAQARVDYLRVHDIAAHATMFERLCT